MHGWYIMPRLCLVAYVCSDQSLVREKVLFAALLLIFVSLGQSMSCMLYGVDLGSFTGY
jgi:hypothetical protein